MATDSISVTYTTGKTVARSYGLTVTVDGFAFVSLPTANRRSLLADLDMLRAECLRQMNNGTIADTPSNQVQNHDAN